METKDYLAYVVKQIYTTIVATVDDEGLPVTAAIDMMDSDDDSLYLLTAKGKGFYDRLVKRGFLAFTAMEGEDTLSSVAVSVRGKVRELGYGKIPELLEKNPYMYKIYPTEKARQALTAFQIYEGTGEWFDLSKSPSNARPSPSAVLKRSGKVSLSQMHAQAVALVPLSVPKTASVRKAFLL